MEIDDVKVGQIVTVSIDHETQYEVVSINKPFVDLKKIRDLIPLKHIGCHQLTLVQDVK
jgi:hypothetical protein